eukprot:g11597.t1
MALAASLALAVFGGMHRLELRLLSALTFEPLPRPLATKRARVVIYALGDTLMSSRFPIQMQVALGASPAAGILVAATLTYAATSFCYVLMSTDLAARLQAARQAARDPVSGSARSPRSAASIKLKKNLASVTALLRRATGGSPRGGSPRGGSPRGGSPRGGSPREGSPRLSPAVQRFTRLADGSRVAIAVRVEQRTARGAMRSPESPGRSDASPRSPKGDDAVRVEDPMPQGSPSIVGLCQAFGIAADQEAEDLLGETWQVEDLMARQAIHK